MPKHHKGRAQRIKKENARMDKTERVYQKAKKKAKKTNKPYWST